jgi:glycosyltransferase involved in cell wall biosynthesis
MRVVHLSTQHRALDVRIYQKECRTLAARGFETHLIVGDPPAQALDGVQFHRFDKPHSTFRPGRIVGRLARAYEMAADLRADVYHFHDPELIPVGLLLKQRGARVVYDVHEDAPLEALTLNKDRPVEGRVKAGVWRAMEEIARRCLDAFVCATPHIAGKFPRRRTVTVQNYPLLAEFTAGPKPYQERPPHVIYAGGITAIRGIREMVRALEHVPEVLDVKFVLLGEFFVPELHVEVAALPGWARTHYLGYQNRSVMQRCLGDARVGLVLFHPEKDHLDAYPNKLFEYMAAGLPVVASDFPLWRRIVAETGGGVVVDPLDPAAIAGAIEHLLTHPAEAEAMGRRGRAAVTERFNWEAEARKLVRLYERLEAA